MRRRLECFLILKVRKTSLSALYFLCSSLDRYPYDGVPASSTASAAEILARSFRRACICRRYKLSSHPYSLPKHFHHCPRARYPYCPVPAAIDHSENGCRQTKPFLSRRDFSYPHIRRQ